MKFKSFVLDLLLYISAFVPMYFLIFIKLIVEIINNNLSFNVLNTINFVTLLSLILLGFFGLYYNVYKSKDETIEIMVLNSQNITDQHFLGYFSLFVFFALPLDLSLVSVFCVYVSVLILIGIVYISNSLYYINPLLNILGYKFYAIDYKVKGQEEVRKAKIFYKGKMMPINSSCFVKIKNDNFVFVDRRHKAKW